MKMHVDYDWSVKKLAETPDNDECGTGGPPLAWVMVPTTVTALMLQGWSESAATEFVKLIVEAAAKRDSRKCLAMIDEFGTQVCSLPESHGGPHVWVKPRECICPTCGLRHGGSNVDGGF